MNIIITLPKELINKIISGEKKFEMRKCLPKSMNIEEDGFFAVEKGTDKIRCWCRVDGIIETYVTDDRAKRLVSRVCVSEDYIKKYAYNKKVYLWVIGKVKIFNDLKRESLIVDKNPQQFAYCPLSYGESI